MKPISLTSSNRQWFEIETAEQAHDVGRRMKTEFGVLFADERKRGGDGRYFVLGDFSVAGRVPGSGPEWTQPFVGELHTETVVHRNVFGVPSFAGIANADPFSNRSLEIAELAQAIGVGITNSAYMNRRLAEGSSCEPSPSP